MNIFKTTIAAVALLTTAACAPALSDNHDEYGGAIACATYNMNTMEVLKYMDIAVRADKGVKVFDAELQQFQIWIIQAFTECGLDSAEIDDLFDHTTALFDFGKAVAERFPGVSKEIQQKYKKTGV
jgi:hypothetical protein